MFTLCMWRIEVICLDNVVPASCHELAVFRKFEQYFEDVKRKFRQIAVNVYFISFTKLFDTKIITFCFYLQEKRALERKLSELEEELKVILHYLCLHRIILNFSHLFHFSASLFDPFLFAPYKPLMPRNGLIEVLGRGHLDRQ